MELIQKRDIFPALATGFTTGLVGWQVLAFLGRPSAFGISLAWLVLLVPVLWLAGVSLGYFLGRWLPPFVQFGKFASIGFANAAVDFGVLYLLIGLTGKSAGASFSFYKAVSFSVATVHSYLWNKFWAFQAGASRGGTREFTRFVGVTLASLGINVGIASLVVNAVGPQFGLGANAWAGVGAVAGSAVALIFSFIGFRFFVFNR